MYPPRGWIVAAAVMLAAAFVGGQARAEIEVGKYALEGGMLVWHGAPADVSGDVQFRIPGAELEWSEAWFLAMPPEGDSTEDYVSVTMTPGMYPDMFATDSVKTPEHRNGQWHVWAVLGRNCEPGQGTGPPSTSGMPADPPEGWIPAYPDYQYSGIIEAAFTAKNLSIASFDVEDTNQEPNPETVVDERELFVAVAGAGLLGHALDFTLTLADGTEIPTVAPVSGLAGLVPLTGGFLHGKAVSAPDAPVEILATWPLVHDGLYYKNVGSTSVPSRIVDDAAAPYLTPFIGLQSMTKTGFTLTGPRAGHFSLSVERDDAFPASTPVSESLYVWKLPKPVTVPEGGWSLLAETDGSTPATLGALDTMELTTGNRSFPLAEPYTFGLSLKDGCPELHRDGQSRWCRPVATTFRPPAAAVFFEYEPVEAGSISYDSDRVWSYLGVVGDGTSDPLSFYSAAHPEGTRGGIVRGGTRDAFLDALQEDEVVYLRAHANPMAFDIGYDASRTRALEDMEVSELLNLPAGCASQMRLFFHGSCDGMSRPYWSVGSLCETVRDHLGAQCAVGFKGVSYSGVENDSFRVRLWAYWTQGMTISAGIRAAVRDYKRWYPRRTDHKWVLRLRRRGDARIAPAFTVPAS